MQDYIPLSSQKSGTVDINSPLKSFEIKQYDNNSRKIYISLRDVDNPNEQTVNLDNHTVRAYFKLPDGGMEYVDGEVIDSDEGTLTVTIPNSVTQQIGTVECEIGISGADDGSFISLRVLRFTVIPSIRDDAAIEATEQFSALENALRKVDGLDSTITAIKNIVTPEMFGAKGDGTTDDSTAFRAALKSGKAVVRCTAGKTYYFSNPVDVRTLTEAYIDMNGCTFKNFKIYINMNDSLTDWRYAYRTEGLHISNGYIGNSVSDADWEVKSQNWNEYCIYAGGAVTLNNVIFVNHLAVLARPAQYLDYLSFTDVTLWINRDLFTGANTDFDAIGEIQADGSITRRVNGLGDGWVFSRCHGWYVNNDYALITFCGNYGTTLIQCVQTRFRVNQFSIVNAIGCHYETCFPVIVDPFFTTVNFDGCYFYTSTKILDYPGVAYRGCMFRALGWDKAANALTVPGFLGGKSVYELSCRIENSFFGNDTYVDTAESRRIRNEPKKTYHWEREYITFECTASEESDETDGTVFDEIGTYTYDFYLLPTNSELEANRLKTVTVTKKSLKKIVDFSDAYCLVGGWGILVYRTSPSGTIHRACIWTDTKFDVKGDLTWIKDYGDFFGASDNGIGRFDIWKAVDSKPEITVNDKLFGVGYAYITTDNSIVSNSSGGVQIATN